MRTHLGCTVREQFPLPYEMCTYITGFRPDLEFDQLYLRPIAKLLNDTESGCTTNQIRRRFITLTQERRDSSSAHAHLRLLLRFRASWMTLHSSTTCLICLNSSPTTHLTCGHTLCDPCTVICATASACEDRNIAIESCPFCGAVNQRIITMRPKTAGLRILDLDGPPTCKLAMWQFLRDIQYYTGLPMSIREHFDLAFGSNIGKAYFVPKAHAVLISEQALFLSSQYLQTTGISMIANITSKMWLSQVSETNPLFALGRTWIGIPMMSKPLMVALSASNSNKRRFALSHSSYLSEFIMFCTV